MSVNCFFNSKGDLMVKTISDKVEQHNNFLIDYFLKVKRLNGCTDTTLSHYNFQLQKIKIHYNRNLDELVVTDLRNYLMDYQYKSQCSNRTLDNIRRVLTSFYQFLEDEDILTKSPAKKLNKIRYDRKIRHPFSHEEIIQMQDACDNMRDRAILDFLLSTGVRAKEFVSINKTDIDFNNREGVVFGKGHKERVIYLSYAAKIHTLKYLESRDDDNPRLFVPLKMPYKCMTVNTLENVLNKISRNSGVKNVYPHRFRRTMACMMLDKGAPLEQVKTLLGHSKIETTLLYANVNQNDVKLNHTRYMN